MNATILGKRLPRSFPTSCVPAEAENYWPEGHGEGDHNYAFLLMGAPGVLGTLTKRHASLQIYGMWDRTTAPFTEGKWDYFDFNGALPPGTPGNSFGGVSGGGLWRVQVYPHPEEQEIASTVALEGVAFYQLGTFEGKGIIRCHGVNSIQKVLESV